MYETILYEIAGSRQAPIVTEFYQKAKTDGLKAALEWRDAKFADGRAARQGQEIR